ncbi:P-type conjugative transfer protein VirB9 [Kosakonia sp. YIM B13611]|uniref:P-type conjugative transfer protein VirB9 n=1 Tax=unclassified Kosakonia TaxID=2632876 RepID=UPI0036B39CFC
MMLKRILSLCILMASCTVWGATVPHGSTNDSRMQTVVYQSQNTAVVNTRPGYITTLLFGGSEEVIDAQAGFPKGWTVTKSNNRVGISPNPITQPVTDSSGNNTNKVFLPTARDWKTNLFVVTSKHDYSLELNVLDNDSPSQAFVIRYLYPDDVRHESEDARAARQKLLHQAQQKQQIAARFQQTTAPRNWRYTKRVSTGSAFIAPDFTYDDGRFIFFGFSPLKRLPSIFYVINKEEQTVTPRITRQGDYSVMAVRATSPHLVLRYGNAVVGIDNTAFGKTIITNGDTISPDITLEAK